MLNDLFIFDENDNLNTLGFLYKPTSIFDKEILLDDDWIAEQALEVGLTIQEEDYRIYLNALTKISNPSIKLILKELMNDTLKIKEQMISAYQNIINDSKIDFYSVKNYKDLKITDELKDDYINWDSNYQKILIFAAKREKIGYDFFSIQTKEVKSNSKRKIWGYFAKLKLNQKQKIESEYDDMVLNEN